MTCKTTPCCSLPVFDFQRWRFLQARRENWSVFLQHHFPGIRDKASIYSLLFFVIWIRTAWPVHICDTQFKKRLCLVLFIAYKLCLAIQMMLPVHCSSIAFICSSVNLQHWASFFHSWGFNWLYARFHRAERICLVCVLWSCLKDKPKSDPSSLPARFSWKRNQTINFLLKLGMFA